MPTYDYVCDACGHQFEAFQSMSEAKLKKCPECKRMKLRRLVGAGAGLIFKGSGFYETDYKKKSGSSDAGSSSSSSSGASDSKSASESSSSKGDAAKSSSSGKDASND